MAIKDIDQVGLDTYKFGFHDDIQPVYTSPKGLSEAVVREISSQKDEPAWMLDFRLEALREFERKSMPTWGADLSRIDFADQAVFDRICSGDTIGMFQVESRAQIQMLRRVQPRNLEDLAVQVAIVHVISAVVVVWLADVVHKAGFGIGPILDPENIRERIECGLEGKEVPV